MPALPQPPTPPAHDPLGVLATAWPVVAAAHHVRIVPERVAAVGAELAAGRSAPPAWDATLHWRDPERPGRTAAWVLVLDALNFCFWGGAPDPDRRWRVRVGDRVHDGYWALAAALTRAADEGVPLWDPAFLAAIPEAEVRRILRPDEGRPGTPEIPLFAARVAHLRELGRGLRRWDDPTQGADPASALIAAAGGSAARLVELIVSTFPSFADTATYGGQEVRFYKRAQILVADLVGAFDGQGLGAFADLDGLTAFADYKVPQVLRRLGVLAYGDDLAARIDRFDPIPAGSPEEVEIRAATVWACEMLRRETAGGHPLRAFEVDWALWGIGQDLPADTRPYHRTPTVFY